MNLQTVQIDLGGGDHAVVYKDKLRRTARLHEAELRKYMTLVDDAGNGGKMLLSELERMETAPKADFIVDYTNVDQHAINEIFILNQTVEWTLGPVDKDTLDNVMTDAQYKTLVAELDRLYKPLPLSDSAS